MVGQIPALHDKCIVFASFIGQCTVRALSLLALTSSFAQHDDSGEPLYTVRGAAERVGIPTATLRSWNQRYGVGPTGHSPGKHRLYSDSDIAIVARMHELIEQGASPRSAARAAIDSVRPARGDAPGLLTAAFDLDVVTVGLLLDRHLRHFGVIDTWEGLVLPAFKVIDDHQAHGDRCIDVEHALSWAVSRSMHRSPIPPRGTSASIILACTPGETHTLALEALRAALAERGYAALMLGADVPRAALVDAVNRIAGSVTAVLWSQTPDTADVETVDAAGVHAEVLVAGPGWEPSTRGTKRVDSLGDAVRHFVPDSQT